MVYLGLLAVAAASFFFGIHVGLRMAEPDNYKGMYDE